ncbi:MAG: hypothetical protein ABSC48_08540 [Terracidiphilus sp.]
MSDPVSRDFMPWFIEFFALACAFGCIDSIREHSPYSQCASFAAASLLLAITGFKWSWIKTKITTLAKSRALRAALAENAELKKQLADTRSQLALPVPPVQSRLVKPPHNVQYVEFRIIESEPFVIAALRFQNVPIPGKVMGKFEWPRLRAIFYENSTGQEIADLSSIQWWDEKDGITDINAEGRDADIASYFEGKWTASETYSDENTLQTRLHSVELPFGDTRIIAALSGGYSNSPDVTVTGVLTLGKDGTASFQRTSD